jgi:hypothetical protein
LKLAILPQAVIKGIIRKMSIMPDTQKPLASIGLCLRQHYQFLTLHFCYIFKMELIKTKETAMNAKS